MQIALINFHHADTGTGGVESRYRMIERALTAAGHECKFLSTEHLCVEDAILLVNSCDLAISDSAVCLESPCPMISIFGNPWHAVIAVHPDTHIDQVIRREKLWHHTHKTYRLAVSNFMVHEMGLNGIRCDRVLPNPADTSRFPEKSEKDYPHVVVWIGPRIPIKNRDQFTLISQTWVDLFPEMPVQWVAVERNAPDKLSYNQMTDQLRRSSAVLCTSWAEGCSNTLMEALAANVPIVTTEAGLFWDWWDDRFGLRIKNPSSTGEFLRQIHYVLTHQQDYSPREAVMENGLDYDAWAKQWQDLVIEVVDSPTVEE
ncbi:MAG: hypothetical protein ABIH23_05820 [bacterium]